MMYFDLQIFQYSERKMFTTTNDRHGQNHNTNTTIS